MEEGIVGFGYYKIIEKIEEGGFSTVYKALQRVLEQTVALKELHPILTKGSKFKERFFKEAETQAKLKHPNIVLVHNFFQEEGRYYIVMEYVEGMVLPDGRLVRTLADLIKEGPLPEDKILSIFQQVLGAVSYAHSLGVIHLDIKPPNVLFTPNGDVKVTDFGIARITRGERGSLFSEIRVGTTAYMSPEQILNKRLDKRSDIYSLGILFYEMATGEVPFQRKEDTSVEEQHLFSPPPKMREKNPKIPQSWEMIIEKALAKRPDDRFQTCEEFLLALRQPELEPEKMAKPKTIPSPSLVGKTKEEAELLTARLGLRLVVDGKEPSELIPEGLIIWQTPEPGRILGEGEEVKIIISKGKEVKLLTVPNLIGKEKKEAEKMLNNLGLRLKVESEEFSQDLPANFVVSQSPKPGEKIKREEEINVILSKGKKPPVTKIVKVPSLIGKERSEAEGIVRDLGLKLVMEKDDYSETLAEGCVLEQSPPAGESLKEGETIKVILSKGKRPFPCPNLIGREKKEAEAEAERNGFRMEIIGEEYFDEIPTGIVLNQIPRSGAPLKGGEAIKVKLSKGPLIIKVPQITEKTEDEARRILAQSELNLVIEKEEYSATCPIGKILSQSPPPGESVRKGSVVKAILSKGEELIEVPVITGKEREEAERILNECGLSYQLAGEEFSETIPANFIINQIPKPGAKLKPKEVVRLTISKGPPLIKLVKVPSLIGKDRKTAEEIVAKLNLRLIVEEGYSDTQERGNQSPLPPGIIFQQSPEPGQEVKEGEVIRIVESKGQKLIKVPVLVGKRVGEAEEELAKDGLKLFVEGEEFSAEMARGLIITQDPEPGRELSPGETIRVILSKGRKPVEKKVVKVPNLLGKRREEAEAILNNLHLRLVMEKEEDSETYPKGSIVQQIPSPGEMREEGEAVRVVISKGKKVIPVKREKLPMSILMGLGVILVAAFSLLFLSRSSSRRPKKPITVGMAQPETTIKEESMPTETLTRLTEEMIERETVLTKKPEVETLARKPETLPTIRPRLETIPHKPPVETTPPPTSEGTPIVPYAKVEVKPNPISIPKPEYPEMARKARIEGQTIVKVLVDVDGSVAEAQILKSSGNDALDEAALTAARQARFTPAKQKDMPVKVWVSIPFNFYLRR